MRGKKVKCKACYRYISIVAHRRYICRCDAWKRRLTLYRMKRFIVYGRV
jgi:hypothetical protein